MHVNKYLSHLSSRHLQTSRGLKLAAPSALRARVDQTPVENHENPEHISWKKIQGITIWQGKNRVFMPGKRLRFQARGRVSAVVSFVSAS